MSALDPNMLVQPAATKVRDPITGRSVWLAGIVRNTSVDDEGTLRFDLVFSPEHAERDRVSIAEAIVANLRDLGFETAIEPRLVVASPPRAAQKGKDPVPGMSGPGVAPHGGAIVKKKLDGVKHVIAVASGKGGVGKSTVATNLAVGLQRAGLSVGLLDADIYGPSLPIMMSVATKPLVTADKKIVPPVAYGVRCLSMGLLVEANEAMIWRGPMVMGIVRQFLQDTAWGELDVLVVDLPPGTGDVQLTLIQAVELAGALIVTTPQDVALADAVRGIQMFRKLDVPLLGVVENMAYYPLPDGTKDFVFGEGGGRRTAAQHATELLAEIPLKTAIRRASDQGVPTVLGEGDDADAFRQLAARVAGALGLATA